jgi:hypothetical protein
MATFIAIYRAPNSVLDDWMKLDEATQKEQMQQMETDWNAWLSRNASFIKKTRSAGATKRVTGSGIADARNDIMMYSIVEAPTHDEAAALFKDHPHLTIPEGSIDVMPSNEVPNS